MSRCQEKTKVYYEILKLAGRIDSWPGNEEAARMIGSVGTKINGVPLSGGQIGSYVSDMFDLGIMGPDIKPTYKGRQILLKCENDGDISHFF